jgi:uncharacterized RDD family membrane protein YckC
MNWYYVEAGRQTGPVTETEFSNLIGTGRIQPETLVWSEGMDNWQPYSAVKAGATASALAPAPVPVAGGSGTTGETAGASDVVCAECGKIFSRDNAIQYGTTWICAACKPVFIQKFKEGAALPAPSLAMNYAGFWIRFAAIFVDGIILWVINLGISLVAGLSFMTAIGLGEPTFTMLKVVLMIVQFAFGVAYETFFLGKFGATPGKMAARIQVINADGTPISYLRAAGRYLAKILSYMICGIGFIIAAFDREKRALHDHICNTRVIRK